MFLPLTYKFFNQSFSEYPEKAMDFHCFVSSNEAIRQASRNPCTEVEGVDYEDVFYAELRRQVLLLTADDADNFAEIRCERPLHSACKPDWNRVNISFPAKLQPDCYFSWWWERQNTNSAPTWLVNLWRKSNGTGVFIPQTVEVRRKYSRRKMVNGRRQVYKQVEPSNRMS